MKKIFTSMMAAAMVVALAGCSNNSTDSSSASESSASESSATAGTAESGANAGTAESGANTGDSTGAHKLGMGVVTSIGSSSAVSYTHLTLPTNSRV